MPRGEPALPAGPAVLAYDADALAGDAASRDVIDQMEAAEAALAAGGAETVRLGVTLDLARFKMQLLHLRPALVCNLVESLDGSDRLQSIVPMLLESWQVPFTGSGSAAMLLSNHKTESKIRLARDGLPVPACAWLADGGSLARFPAAPAAWRGDAIIKTLDSHASLHIDDASVLRSPDDAALAEALRAAEEKHGMKFFAEEYIEGREFNISVLETPDGGAEVLPPAEISFAGLPAGRPRIVGYAAKWEEDSAEYIGTPRTFDYAPEDAPLLESLRRTALAAWKSLGLAGYARVDFRADAAGNIFILEANANPCLSPDAGLCAAAEQAGHDFAWLLQRIIRAALRRAGS